MSTIYKEILNDHDIARKLMKEIVNLDLSAKDQRADLFNQLQKELLAHANAEEKSLYKAMKSQGDSKLKDKAEHSVEEHVSIEKKLEKLTKMSSSSEDWLVKFKELKSCLEHHMDEEEQEVFEVAQKAFNKSESDKLGDEMVDQKIVEKGNLHIEKRQKA